MYDYEENELKEIGSKLNITAIPETIDDYIMNGLQKGQKMKKKNRMHMFRLIAAAAFIGLFVISVRISPAFAAAASRIPGLEYIVKLINYDRGISDAVQNNFIQHVGVSDEHEGLKLTINDIICDESKIILFYSLENKDSHGAVQLHEMKFTDEMGRPMQAGMSWGYGDLTSMNRVKQYEDKVELSLITDGKIPDKLFVTAKLAELPPNDPSTNTVVESTVIPDKHTVVLASTWKFQINIDTKKFLNKKVIHQLDKVVEVQGQKIIFRKLTITPTLASLDLEYDRQNTKKILYFDDIALMDGNNDKWGTIINGVTGSKPDDFHQTIYFQSNYFRNPTELYLVCKSIRAVDASKSIVTLDVDKKLFLNTPDDNLTLKTIIAQGNKLYVDYTLKADNKIDQQRCYSVFGEITDKAGRYYNIPETTSRTGDQDNLQHEILCIEGHGPADQIHGNLYLKISDYPQRITADLRIRVK